MLDDDVAAALTGINLRCEHDYETSCKTCHLRLLCLPAGLPAEELRGLEAIIEHHKPVEKNGLLYRQGEVFTSLYAVLVGGLKTYQIESNGQARITGCHLPGEILGFSGIDQGKYLASAEALTSTLVCEIPFHDLEELSRLVPGLQSQLFQLMSRRIVEDHQVIAQFFDKHPARKRIAAFVISLSTRAVRRGESATQLFLPMSRTEIGSYLAVSPETVSREFSRLVKQGVIAVSGRDLRIIDVRRLRLPVLSVTPGGTETDS